MVRPPPAGKIVCDPEKLRRVVEGVLSNAAKFTKNGRITFSASMQDDSWIVSVQDTGIGIAETQMTSLFETFGKAEDETASKYGDEVRLGLPLAYRYCQLMGGKLTVRSRLSEGSTVTVTLPRAPRGVDEPTNARVQFRPQAA